MCVCVLMLDDTLDLDLDLKLGAVWKALTSGASFYFEVLFLNRQ